MAHRVFWLPAILTIAGLWVLPANRPASVAVDGSDTSMNHDTTGAVIELERTGNRYDVQGLFVNRDGPTGELRYSLNVERTGQGGSMTSSQSGTFSTAPQKTDTLSTVTVNAGVGTQLSIRLEVREGKRLIDTQQQQLTVESAADA